MQGRLYRWCALFLLGLFFALALSSATVKSATTDEGYHLAMGYSYLRALDPRPQTFYGQPYPNLAGSWASLPLLLEHEPLLSSNVATDKVSQGFWDYVFDLFDAYYHSPHIIRYTFSGRVQIILLGVLLGALVFRWAKEWLGIRAALLACFLYVFSPNILAHSRLITTDVPAAAACFLTMYLTQRLLRRPNFLWTILVGLVLGGALLVKYSTLLLVPTIAILLLLAAWRRDWSWTMWPGRVRQKALLRAVGMGCVIFGIAGLIVWAAFGFEVQSPQRIDVSFPIPAASYVDEIIYHTLEERPAFLLGQQWVGGQWYYFFATLLFKTPPPMLFLLLVTLLAVVHRRRLDDELPLWIFPAIYFLVSLTSGFNIGHRHLLPLLPFAFVFVSQIVPEVYDRVRIRWVRASGVALAAWYLGASLCIYPHYLAYFNLFAGGPSKGYRVLVDSNLDWGQDLIQLRRYMERKQLDEVWLSLFSDADPALYGVRYRELPNWADMKIPPGFHYLHPAPGVYVISATFLQGMYLPNPSTFNWFLHQRPVDQIGYSMLVYQVNEDHPSPTWVGMCYTPEVLLSPDEMAAGFGRTDLHVVHFDCHNSGVIPRGDTPGWYVVPPSVENSDSFITGWLEEATLEFEQYADVRNKVFAVYRLDVIPTGLRSSMPPVRVIRAGSRTDAATSDSDRFSLPLDVDGLATFLGYEMDGETIEPGKVFAVRTFWQAGRTVTEMLPSVFAHLVDENGQAWSVGDALGYPAIQWHEGDIFVQQHGLEVPFDIPRGTYWIASGLYDLSTGLRYPVPAAGADVDTFLIGPVVVE